MRVNNMKYCRSLWKKLAAFLLCLALAETFALAVPTVEGLAAKKKVKISDKKITLQVKRKKTVTLQNTKKKVRWSVSGKKLVKIKAKGKKKQKAVITAGKKTGTCYVVAKAGGRKYRCKVTVKKAPAKTQPAQPGPGPGELQPEPFEEKPMSNSAKDLTSKYKAQTVEGKAADDKFVKAMADTSVRLLQESAAAGEKGSNILISPESILTALAMAQNGAAGETLSQMQTALGGIAAEDYSKYLYTLNKRAASTQLVEYSIANSIWYKDGQVTVKEPFLQKNVNYFSSQVLAAPFNDQTVGDINNWVYNHTKGKIPSILSNLEPDMRLALINAIYFKGEWADPYGDPRKDIFTNANGQKQDAQMLASTEDTYVTAAGAEGFIKPYCGGKQAFLALLPPEGTSADDFVKALSGKDLTEAYKNRQTRQDDHILVRTKMPVFGYDYEVSLGKPLQALGITLAFSDLADFSGMAQEPVCIDEVLHKTHIALDQNGTEAAAVTAIVMKASSALDPQQYTEKIVYLDRPFVYAIIDTETGLPLFLGVVNSL